MLRNIFLNTNYHEWTMNYHEYSLSMNYHEFILEMDYCVVAIHYVHVLI